MPEARYFCKFWVLVETIEMSLRSTLVLVSNPIPSNRIINFLSTRAYDYVYTRTYTHVTAPPHAKDKRACSKHVRTHTSPHTIISHKQSTCARHSFCKVKIKNQKAERIHSLSYRSIEFQTNCNIPFRCHGCNAPPLTIRLTVTRNSSCSV